MKFVHLSGFQQFSCNFDLGCDAKMAELTHFDDEGNARMVDVGGKPATSRIARASCSVEMLGETVDAIREGKIGKGDVLQVARLAGIMAAKQTPNLIPLCHSVSLSSVEVEFAIMERHVEVSATASAVDRTGVEMEALTATTVAALTVYDMCKSIDREMTSTRVRLEEKSGGKSGRFVRQGIDDGQAD